MHVLYKWREVPMKLIFNVKKILAVKVATHAVAKRRLEEIELEGKLEFFEAFSFV